MTAAPAADPSHPVSNFDLLRLFAALLVFWFHSDAILGIPPPMLFSWVVPGALGVFIFFVISGYLVGQSWEHDPDALRFLARRALRIFPALVVLVLLTALVLGPVLTTLPLHDYFHDPRFGRYFHNAILLPFYALPGMFEHSRVAGVVNGSLWSLPVEFTCYLCLLALGAARAPRWLFGALALAGCAATLAWSLDRSHEIVFYGMILQDVVQNGTYFLIGVCVGRFRLERFLTVTSLCVAIVAMIAAEPWPLASRVVSWLAFPAVFLTFGRASSVAARGLARLGDYSYGVYIYAFPVQQAVVTLWPEPPVAGYVLVTLGLTLAFAAASWHLIERPSLRLKPRRRRATAGVPG